MRLLLSSGYMRKVGKKMSASCVFTVSAYIPSCSAIWLSAIPFTGALIIISGKWSVFV